MKRFYVAVLSLGLTACGGPLRPGGDVPSELVAAFSQTGGQALEAGSWQGAERGSLHVERQAPSGVGFTVSLGASVPRVLVEREGGMAVGFSPHASPMTVRAASLSAGRAYYVSEDGLSAVVLTPTVDGVKEDWVLTRPLGDRMVLSWSMELGEEHEARLLDDGSVGVFGPAKGGVRVGRERPKSELLFRLPAPVVREAGGQTASVGARYRLEGALLMLEATGLAGLRYPVSIDPTVVVTTTAQFKDGNNEGGIDTAQDQLSRGKPFKTNGTWHTTGWPQARYSHAVASSGNYLYVLGGNDGTSRLSSVWVTRTQPDGSTSDWRDTSPLPSAREGMASVVAGGYLYVLGGRTNGGVNTECWAAKINTGGMLGSFFAVGSGLPTAREGATAVTDGSYLYVLGGNNGTVDLDEVVWAPLLADGEIGVFQATSSFPVARREAGAAVFGGRLYLVGGRGASLLNSVQYAVLNGDGTIGNWTWSASLLPSARYGFAMSASDGRIQVAGGSTATSWVDETLTAAVLAGGDVGAFAAGPRLTHRRGRWAGVLSNGYLHLFGGLDDGGALDDHVSAQINPDGTLSNLTASHDFGRASHGAQVVGNYAYLVGGVRGSHLLDNVVFAPIGTDGLVGRWRAASPLIDAVRDLAVTTSGGYLYAIAGINSLGLTSFQVMVAQQLAGGDLSSWTYTSALVAAGQNGRKGLAATAANGKVYALGGQDPGGVGMRSDVSYASVNPDGTLNPWVLAAASLPTTLTEHEAVVSNGAILVMGGTTTGLPAGATAAVSYAPILPAGDLGPFTVTTGLGVPRYGHAAMVTNGRVYVAGGWNGVTTYATTQSAPLNGNGSIGAWTAHPDLPVALHDLRIFPGVLRMHVQGGERATAGKYLGRGVVGELRSNGYIGSYSARRLEVHGLTVYDGTLYRLGGQNDVTTQFADVTAQALPGGGWVDAPRALTPLPSARIGVGAAAYNGFLFALGGRSASTDLDEALVATIADDGSIGSWRTTTQLPAAAFGHCVVAHRGRIFVVQQGTNLNVWGGTVHADGSIDAWDSLSPTISGFWGGHRCAAVDDTLYVLGGNSDLVISAPILSDGTLGAFVWTSNLPASFHSGAALAYNGSLLYLGGLVGVTYYNWVEFAPVSGKGRASTWFPSVNLLPTVLGHHQAVAHEGWVYVLGGRTSNTTWNDETLTAPLYSTPLPGPFTLATNTTFNSPIQRTRHGAVVYNGHLYVVGGYDIAAGGERRLDTVVSASIDPQSGALGSFSTAATLPEKREFLDAVAYNGWLYVVGGDSLTTLAISEVLRAPINPNGTLGAFSTTTALPAGVAGHRLALFGGRIYLVGGYQQSTSQLPVLWSQINADGTLGAWNSTTAIPQARSNHAVAAYDGYLYVLGGCYAIDTPCSKSTVWVAPIQPGGNLGAFTNSTPLFFPLMDPAFTIHNGVAYVAGGSTNGMSATFTQATWYAPVGQNGVLGSWNSGYNLDKPIAGMVLVADPSSGYLYGVNGEMYGIFNTNMRWADMARALPRAQWSKLVDLGPGVTNVASITVNGSAALWGTVNLEYRVAPASGVMAAPVQLGRVALGSPVLVNEAGARYLWLKATLDDNSTALADPAATNARNVTDVVIDYTDLCQGVVCPGDQCNTPGTCNPATGTCSSSTPKAASTPCDDGVACTYGETCDGSGVCKNGTTLSCSDDQCNTRACNGTSSCTVTPLTGNSCNDGQACTYGETCNGSGVCTGGSTVTCTSDQCNTRACNGTSSCTVTPLTGNSCNDGQACTYGETCNGSGVCTGGSNVTCTSDQCNTRACNGTSTCTVTPLTGNSCNDGQACTYGETCNGSGVCTGGSTVTCTSDQCNTRACNGTSSCTVTPLTGNSCDDGQACTYGETCNGSGVCTGGSTVVCTSDQCNSSTCNGTSTCTVTPLTGNSCSDGDPCTYGETCNGQGTCATGTSVSCTNDACNTRTCDGTSGCAVTPLTGNSCDDGSACTQTDTCQSGVCEGTNPVVCTAKDPCHDVGTCDTATGVCSDPAKQDGAFCDDTRACTTGDQCLAGVCTPASSTCPCASDNDCFALDQCHQKGTCNTGTGTCSTPSQPDGTPCNDANDCTSGETCQSGACGSPTATTSCSPSDSCHLAGTCDPATGVCSDPPAPNGGSCSDGRTCTSGDHCESGTCSPTTSSCPCNTNNDCFALDQCHVPGTCDQNTNLCSNPVKSDGSGCDDGDACTMGESCQLGTCSQPTAAVTCTAKDECHAAGVCDKGTGVCSDPARPDGTPCSVGTCVSGHCQPQADAGTSGDGGSPGPDAGPEPAHDHVDHDHEAPVPAPAPSSCGCGTNSSPLTLAALLLLASGFRRRRGQPVR